MERESEYLLHLLGAFLREQRPEPAEGIDWDRLLAMAQSHGVLGIVGYMGTNWRLCADGGLRATFRSLCLSTMGLFARKTAAAQTLVEELERAGIDHILMKGYQLRDCYPVPELRTFNDIDVVIRREDRQRSHRLMLDLGFQPHTDWEPVYSYFREEELYEFHTEIMEIDVAETGGHRAYFQNMWQYARPVSGHGYRFTPEFHFLYLLTHIAKHIHGSGAGVRMYLDLAAFVRRFGPETDWNWVRQELGTLGLDRFAAVALRAAERWFGVPVPYACGEVKPEVLTAFRDFTLEAGTFGQYRDPALAGLKHSPEGDASRLKQLLRRSFPSAATIRTRYTYLQDKPWLLPVAWVHRLVKTRDSFGAHAREARGIFRTDAGEVRRLKRLARDIGL